MKTTFRTSILIATGLAALAMAGCGPGVVFSAPETDPPGDLIPGYLPEGFELVSGFELTAENRWAERETGEADGRGIFPAGLFGPSQLEVAQSPAGSPVLGVQYRRGDDLLLITKSSFPDGDLDRWWEAVQAAGPQDLAGCECAGWLRAMDIRQPLSVEFVRERLVEGVRIAVVEGPRGRLTIFVRGDDLLTIQGALPEAEILKVIASLLP